MVDILEEDAKTQGYLPDASVAGDEVEHGARPKPFMLYRNLDLLDVHPIQSVIKVDDTISGVGEALEACGYAGESPVGEPRLDSFFELHIEQGPVLEEEGKTIGVVTGVLR